MSEQPQDDRPAGDDRLNRLYADLHALAQRHLKSERSVHTLSATALVNEAFLRLHGPRRIEWQSDGHYFAAAAVAMRRILVDHARARGATRRGGPQARRAALNLNELPDPNSVEELSGFLILDETISRLERADSQAAAVVRLRYFAGLSIAETAEALRISEPTVKRAWVFARAWLKETIERET